MLSKFDEVKRRIFIASATNRYDSLRNTFELMQNKEETKNPKLQNSLGLYRKELDYFTKLIAERAITNSSLVAIT